LLSALATFAVPTAFGVAEALPAVESESASPGLGHRGLHGHEPYRLDEGNCRSMRASPFRLVAYLDPWLRAATSPGRAEKLGAACGGDGDDDQDEATSGTRVEEQHAGVPLRRC